MSYVKITGLGKYTPENIVTNDDLSTIVDTNDEWIISRTGIRERRISTGEDTTDLAVKAAKMALKDANVSPEDIDLIIVATITSDNVMPSVACGIQAEIGAVNAAAFDITAACSGQIYGINIATNFILSGQCSRVLVVGSEVLSKIVDWKDRSTCVLFGDGASAFVIEKSDEIEGIKSISIGSDGVGGNNLTCSSFKLENSFVSVKPKYRNKIEMNGKQIFKFAVNTINKSVNDILSENNLSINDIDYIVCHQANSRILELAAKRLSTDIDKFYMNLDKYGNTSGASIGIALTEMKENNLLKNGNKIILIGFGGGLTWGSALVEWTM